MHDDHNHNHDSDTHSMNCPVEGCTYVVKVHAHDDEEAVMKMMEVGKTHFMEAHPNAEGMSPEEMESMTRESMTKLN